MSLEQALNDNTAAVRELLAAIKAGGVINTASTTAAAATGKPQPSGAKTATAASGPATAKAVEAAAPASTAAASSPDAASAATAPQASTAAADITYEQVGKAITDGVKANRDHVVATLAAFGAKKGPDLKPEQYADFMKALAAEPEAALA